jgi:hypothetical protein
MMASIYLDKAHMTGEHAFSMRAIDGTFFGSRSMREGASTGSKRPGSRVREQKPMVAAGCR